MIKINVTDQHKIVAMTYALSMGLSDLATIHTTTAEDKRKIKTAITSFQNAIADLQKLIQIN